MDKYSLVIENLVKKYGKHVAVNNISLKVKEGAFFAFLGINGAGKSTTINVICSILQKDSGKVFVNGHDLDGDFNFIKNDIGIVFQNSVLDDQLSVYQNLKIRSSFYPMTKEERQNNLDHIIKLLELEPILNQSVRRLSGGQRRRVDIARAMVHRPRLLILDEPTTGLDPKTRKIVWNLINKVRIKHKMTVFLTTHYMEEAEKATFVTIMDKGNIIAEGTPNELKNMYAKDYVCTYLKRNVDFEKMLNESKLEFEYDASKKGYKIYPNENLNSLQIINKFPQFVTDFEILKGTMDDVFLKVTKANLNSLEEEE